MRIGVNCGHTVSGTQGSGAVGYLNESNETRAVGYALMRLLKNAGHTVVNCTDDYSASTGGNLRAICSLANAQPLDLFLSIHFNAGRGQGCEVFTYGKREIKGAREVNAGLARLGFVNRGIKDGANLYVVRRTNSPAMLVEICFVDTKTDAELYKAVGADKIAEVLFEAITGEKIKESEGKKMTNEERVKFNELVMAVSNLAAKVDKLSNPMIYNYIDDNMPEWARPTVQKLVDKKILKGDENGLNLTEELLRILVINDRAGIYDKEA